MQRMETTDEILEALRPALDMVAGLPQNAHSDAARKALIEVRDEALRAIQQPVVPAGGPNYTN